MSELHEHVKVLGGFRTVGGSLKSAKTGTSAGCNAAGRNWGVRQPRWRRPNRSRCDQNFCCRRYWRERRTGRGLSVARHYHPCETAPQRLTDARGLSLGFICLVLPQQPFVRRPPPPGTAGVESHDRVIYDTQMTRPMEYEHQRSRFYKDVGSRVWLHLPAPLTCAFGNCLTAVAARFVSRNAAFPTAFRRGTPCDQRVFNIVARHDILSEKMSAVKIYKCRFSFLAASVRRADLRFPKSHGHDIGICLTNLNHPEFHAPSGFCEPASRLASN